MILVYCVFVLAKKGRKERKGRGTGNGNGKEHSREGRKGKDE